MKLSLNRIAEEIALSLGDQFNFTLREAIKNTVCDYREKLLREEDYNSGLNRNDFTQTIIINLVDYVDDLGRKHKITEKDVPLPVRFKSRGRSRFDYIGGVSLTQPFSQTDFTELEFINNLSYQMPVNYYIWREQKIIVYKELKRCKIAVRAVFANPRELVNVCDNLTDVDDDSNFPISGDLITIIKKAILSGDFPIRQLGEEKIIGTNTMDEKDKR